MLSSLVKSVYLGCNYNLPEMVRTATRFRAPELGKQRRESGRAAQILTVPIAVVGSCTKGKFSLGTARSVSL